MDNNLLKENFNYYIENHDEIVKLYLNKYIIIKDKKIVDSYNTFEEAVAEASKKYELGTFIIQKCNKDIEESTQVFHSRVII